MDVEHHARALRGLYAVTPECADTARLAALVEACLEGGAALVQYRAKSIDAAHALAQARQLRELCRSFGVPLVVNDSLDLALAAGADGVHLGRDDGDPAAARAALPGGLLGVSCYDDVARARAARSAGADYVAVGSIFPSPTKPHARRAPLEFISEAKRASGLPVAAIGGIDAANASLVIAAGADLVAVIGGVFDSADVRGSAQAIARLFEDASIRNAPDVRTQPTTL